MPNSGNIWAMVPARGGSKSIPYKNLAPLAGRPLLDYGVGAAIASDGIRRIICSTEDERIARRALELGIEVDPRPAALAGDDTPVAEVAKEMLERIDPARKVDILILVQPTSPFLLPSHIDDLLAAMQADPGARSGQTITPVPHNHHAWNQRMLDGEYIRFHFAAERRAAYNKQRKTAMFTFGNLVATRADAIRAGDGFFADPSIPIEISWPYDLDIDIGQDLLLAEALIASRAVDLPHLTNDITVGATTA